MIPIIRNQIAEGLQDAKFLFMAVIVLISFIANAFIYSERYQDNLEDFDETVANTTNILATHADCLQELTNYPQTLIKPPASLAFIADGGDQMLPNSWTVNAFVYRNPENLNRKNEMLPLYPGMDWVFIVGTLMTLMSVLVSFGSICGDKKEGTLRLLMSYPVSRAAIFFGKFLGLFVVVASTFVVGAVINVGILHFNGVLPFTGLTLTALTLAMLMALLCISLAILASMAVSSFTSRPAISLVVAMTIWMIAIVAVPGMARLLAEQMSSVRSNFEVSRDVDKAVTEYGESCPPEAGNWHGDPFAPYMTARQEMVKGYTRIRATMWDESYREKLNQARLIKTISSISPAGLIGSAFEELAGTGTTGFEQTWQTARRYQQILHDFTVDRDAADKDSAHLVYSWGFSSDWGVYSRKPVDFSTVPKFKSLWRTGGMPQDMKWPVMQVIIFLLVNMAMAMMAFFGMMKYDPR